MKRLCSRGTVRTLTFTPTLLKSCPRRFTRVVCSRLAHTDCTVLLRVRNLSCGACASKAEKAIRSVGGDKVTSASVSVASNLGLVTLNDRSVLPDVISALSKAGYPSTVNPDVSQDDQTSKSPRKSAELLRSTLQIAALVGLAVLVHAGHCGTWGMISPPLAAVLAGGTAVGIPTTRNILRDGLMSLYYREPNMNSLVSIASVIGYGAGLYGLVTGAFTPSFHEQIILLAVVAGGRMIEASLRKQASRQMQDLAALQPRVATLANGSKVLTENLKAGDQIVVVPGERFPVDCVVIDGTTEVNTAVVTGENAPVVVKEGDEVLSGSLHVGTNGVTCKVAKVGSESFMSEVQRMVALMQASKTPTLRIADAVAGKFCWFVIAASFLTFLAWTSIPALAKIASSMGKAFALRLAVSVVIVACPCALGLAAPMAIYIASASAARRGILFRSATALETLSTVTTVAFDKTGTLTRGHHRVVSKRAMMDSHLSPEQVGQIAAKVERHASHPIAAAIVRDAFGNVDTAAQRQTSNSNPVPEGLSATDVQFVPGGGAFDSATQTDIGNISWLRDARNVKVSEESYDVESDLARAGNTVVGVAQNGRIVGLIALRDEVDKAVGRAVHELKSRGIKVWILSGDGREAVLAAGEEVDIPESNLRWRLRPMDKVSMVEALRSTGEGVCTVGDGVNDAPFVSSADVGICVTGGSGITEVNADVICAAKDVPSAINIARTTRSTIYRNIFWALAYNLILIPIAAGVLVPTPLGFVLSPPMAAAGMSLSSTFVVANSLLILPRLPKKAV